MSLKVIFSGQGTCPRCSFCPGKFLMKYQHLTVVTHAEGSNCCQDGDCKCGIKKTARIVGGQETQVNRGTQVFYCRHKKIISDEMSCTHFLIEIWKCCLTQSVVSWLELKLAWAKKNSSLAGLAQRQSQNPSVAQRKLEQVLNFWAELGLQSGIF